MSTSCSPLRRGMTLVEVMVSLMVLGIFVTTIFMIYRNTMQSYSITNWKQQKTSAAQLFWENIRKPLEEASDELSFGGAPGFLLATVERPVRVKTGRFTGSGDILLWAVDKIEIDPGTVPRVGGTRSYRVNKTGDWVTAAGPGMRTQDLTDVEAVEITFTDVCRQNDAPFEEYISPQVGTDKVVGAVLEIAILFRPNPLLRLPEVKLVQNAKFKVHVKAEGM